MGYHRAGFEIVGVDHAFQPRFPFVRNQRPFTFLQNEAVSFLMGLINDTDCAGGWRLSDFDAIHASPPCQAFTVLRHRHPDKDYPDLVAQTRELLRASGLPWIIENVPGAPLLKGSTMLCGTMFGLRSEGGGELWRHRWFETSFSLLAPQCRHSKAGRVIGVYGDHVRDRRRRVITVCGHGGGHIMRRAGHPDWRKEEGQQAMGIDWMTMKELSQAIPPAYTEYIGKQLIRIL